MTTCKNPDKDRVKKGEMRFNIGEVPLILEFISY